MQNELIKIGYWSKTGSEIQVDSISSIEKSIIISRLEQVRKEIPIPFFKITDDRKIKKEVKTFSFGAKVTYKGYRGSSRCRLCGCRNGSLEYRVHINGQVLVVPEGYVHYLRDHNVVVDKRLLPLGAL